MKVFSCHVDRTAITAILPGTSLKYHQTASLFISSRITVGQILDFKLMITTTITIIIILIIIIIMYFTTLEHLKAGIKGEELLYPDTLS